jgi:DNA-binding response OmpR family regulator
MAKILLVDDEPGVLAGYARALHNEFEVDTAVGGERGLETIHTPRLSQTCACLA